MDGFDSDPLSYSEFKKFMLTNDEAKKLEAACHNQFRTGIAQDKYYEYLKDNSAESAKEERVQELAKILDTAEKKKEYKKDKKDKKEEEDSEVEDNVVAL
jgi:hypothetical protein